MGTFLVTPVLINRTENIERPVGSKRKKILGGCIFGPKLCCCGSGPARRCNVLKIGNVTPWKIGCKSGAAATIGTNLM